MLLRVTSFRGKVGWLEIIAYAPKLKIISDIQNIIIAFSAVRLSLLDDDEKKRRFLSLVEEGGRLLHPIA